MSIEHVDITKRITNIGDITGFRAHEDPKVAEARKQAILAGNFLRTSGISDAVIDFRQGFLGDMGNLRNEICVDENWLASSASIILEWIDPDDLRHLILKVTVGNNNKDKYISTSFKEIAHHKRKKYDPYLLEISVLPLGKELDFTEQVVESEKMRYRQWLEEKILNYEHFWGEV